MIEFHLDNHSGVAPYLQLVQQVKQAQRLGLLGVGDQLPTVREVVAQITINPNTVLKAYRELEREGLVVSKPGQGRFLQGTRAGTSLSGHPSRLRGLVRCLHGAYEPGLSLGRLLARFMPRFRHCQRAPEETD